MDLERMVTTRLLLRIAATLFLFSLAVYVFWLVREVVLLVFIAVFLAIALGPAVDFFARLKIPRALSILVTYLTMLLIVLGIGALIVPPVVDQVQELADNAPQYLQDIRDNSTIRELDERYKLTQELEEQAGKLPSALGSAAGTLQSITLGIFSGLVELIAVLSITFFLLIDGRRITEFLFGLMRPDRQARARKGAHRVYTAVAGYVAGNLIISLMAGVVTWVTLTLLGVKFAVPLAVLVAFLDLIPLVGATIGAILVGIVTLFFDFPTATIVWVAVALAYQQFENHVVQPLVYNKTVDVRPLVVIVAILIGASLLGVLGALVAIPVAATVQIVLRDVWEHRQAKLAASAATAAAGDSTPA